MPRPRQRTETGYTYADYQTWNDNERWEIIGGEAWNMSPAPGRTHQTVSRRMAFEIHALLKDEDCEVFYAPFDVRLAHADSADQEISDVVQPDILVVCDPEKLDERGCKGAPDWIIEITAPKTASRDHIAKRKLYERHGVGEYWIVQPVDRVVMVYRLDPDGRYARPDVYGETDVVSARAVPGLVMDLKRVFTHLPPSLSAPGLDPPAS